MSRPVSPVAFGRTLPVSYKPLNANEAKMRAEYLRTEGKIEQRYNNGAAKVAEIERRSLSLGGPPPPPQTKVMWGPPGPNGKRTKTVVSVGAGRKTRKNKNKRRHTKKRRSHRKN